MLLPSGANCSEFLLPGVVVTCFVTAGSVANSSKAYAKMFVWPATFDVTTTCFPSGLSACDADIDADRHEAESRADPVEHDANVLRLGATTGRPSRGAPSRSAARFGAGDGGVVRPGVSSRKSAVN